MQKDKQIYGPCQRTEKTVEHEGENDTNCSWCAQNTLPKAWRRDWKNWKSVGESKPFRTQHCEDQQEYWDESWRPEETCCYSDSTERSQANFDVKNSQGVK